MLPLIQSAFVLLCTLGLITHVTLITKQYFEYPSTNSITMDLPQEVPIPQLSICFRYADILDLSHLNTATGLRLEPLKSADLLESLLWLQMIHRNLTLKQIFDFTPKADQVYGEGIMRYPGSYDITFNSEPIFRREFSSSKFYLQEYICYQIVYQCETNCVYDYNQVASALRFPGMVYEFGFNLALFNSSVNVLATIHGNTDPTDSIHLAPIVKRLSKENKLLTMFFLTYRSIETTRLPSPYKSDCRDYTHSDNPFGSQLTCFSRCLIDETTKVMNLFPFATIIFENDDIDKNRKVIDVSHDLTHNKQASEMLTSLERKCHAACRRPDCNERIFLTVVQSKGFAESTIAFRVHLVDTPNIKILHQPMISVYDYLTLVLSCFGVWLGLSLHDFNPVSLIVRLRKMTDSRRHPLTNTQTHFLTSRTKNKWAEIIPSTRSLVNQSCVNTIMKELKQTQQKILDIKQTMALFQMKRSINLYK